MKITGNQRQARTTNVRATSPEKRADSAYAAAQATAPNDTVSVAGIPKEELTPRVMRALTELMQEVSSLRQELSVTKARMEELTQMAYTDPLTGVYNRRAFVTELNRTVALVNRHPQPASLAFFDLDNMKSINDNYGHAGGDLAVQHVASVIKQNIRESDVIGRLGGDEFGVVFNYAGPEIAGEKVASLQEIVRSTPITLEDKTFSVTVTAGVAPIRRGESAEAALDLADAAMYDGKKGRAKPK
ncbi:MAG: GGDEF domain-containing protein [Parvularculaceae bacterium]|nr:MAG: GGDEF domain-containing protein [Parvularculaceae bacterium]